VRPLVFVAVAVTAFLAFSALSFWLVVRPPRLAIPGRLAEVGLAGETVTIVADDGVQLAGWLVSRPGAPAVVLLHGYPADKADLLPLAAALHPRFTTLLLDLRYFGESGGGATTLGARERGDLKRALDLLEARGFRRVGVFGLSLGGAVAIMTAAEDARIRAVAAYGVFADLRTLGHDVYAWLGPVKYPLVEMMLVWGRLALRVDLATPSPVTAARALSTPVLLVHSRDDEQIAFRHAERLQQALAANPHAEFAFAAYGPHGALPADFGGRLSRFFARHLDG
jgi:dipeptidyl aminopeptidase/acylaminoacyl peptidase